jgi:hypothetical protein
MGGISGDYRWSSPATVDAYPLPQARSYIRGIRDAHPAELYVHVAVRVRAFGLVGGFLAALRFVDE